MENSGDIDSSLQIIRHPSSYKPTNRSSWFDLRVFYIRISNVFINDSTPDSLTVNHIPLSPETHLEVNGVRCGMHSEGISSQLRRDRVDKKSEEATFVSTDSIRLNGSVKFEIFYKEEIVLFGVLEMISSNNGYNSAKRWSMDCEPVMTVGGSGKQELLVPTMEVYITGSFSGSPVILTKTVHLNVRKKNNRRKALLDSIPEYEDDKHIHESRHDHLQAGEYGGYKSECGEEEGEEYNSLYWGRTDYMEGEDGELTWFNAGVRVGVGIGLGICLGLGVGVGLLVRTYQSTTGNLKRRFG
ncbi:uncharacterized protein At1g01500-like [Impatiens glandulifera]|uniref:uncharacterized protein At1g01500-like n=1 Tax=Impatiens glandulifera TaxID=253017 RepID=UPI001FB05354|nr:uncharacterized protein At1g01500-like [Impatiens glandulifera]